MAITINPTGLPSTTVFGTPSVTVQVKTGFDLALETDLQDVFFNTEEFARTIIYKYANGRQQSLDVIFDEEGTSLNIEATAPVLIDEPMFQCSSDDLVYRTGKGDTVRVGNRWFEVMEVNPNGVGVSVAILKKV
jgi:hypothetical protein